MSSQAPVSAETVLEDGVTRAIWKFGYGSNMSQAFLRDKKNVNPIRAIRAVLHGYSLVFPHGRGIDMVEPSFATLLPDPGGFVHGVATLFKLEDAANLDKQEGSGRYYASVTSLAKVYSCEEAAAAGITLVSSGMQDQESDMMYVEVYVSKRPAKLGSPQGPCSDRYRNIIVAGAKEAGLHSSWIKKLEQLPVYTPSAETLARRKTVPHPSDLPRWSIEDLRRHDGNTEGLEVHFSSCGFIFKHQPIFSVFKGRDVTFRNSLQRRGINLDANDDGGLSPFPQLVELEPHVLEYCLRFRDRFLAKSGNPVAVLSEFWDEQRGMNDGRLAALQIFAEPKAVVEATKL